MGAQPPTLSTYWDELQMADVRQIRSHIRNSAFGQGKRCNDESDYPRRPGPHVPYRVYSTTVYSEETEEVYYILYRENLFVRVNV